METRTHIVVSGLVQGVGFRWFVQRKAGALGLSGWVRNLVDGSVEVEAQGDRSLIAQLIGDLKVGPRSAHVHDVEVETIGLHPAETGFQIR
jgi:acylphosphatase